MLSAAKLPQSTGFSSSSQRGGTKPGSSSLEMTNATHAGSMRSPVSNAPWGLASSPAIRGASSPVMRRWEMVSWVTPNWARYWSSKKCPNGPCPTSCSRPPSRSVSSTSASLGTSAASRSEG